jgi:uncharacterized protein YbjT (DUF2867 family)
MILVTGATGNSGQAVVKKLTRQGVPVRALVRDEAKAQPLTELPGASVVVGDMMRPQSLRAALDGISKALLISTAGPTLLESQVTFIDAAKAAGIDHIIKFSGKESNIGFVAENFRYTRNHEQIERYLEQSGLGWTHLRPSQFMQVYLREAPSIATSGVLALPLGDVQMAPVDIEDIAEVACKLLTTDGHKGKAYEMTGPEALSMSQVAGLIGDAIGKPVEYVNISPESRRDGMIKAGAPQDFAEALYEQALERLKHPASRVNLETHQVFGVEPTTFGDFVKRYKHLFV